MRYALILIFFSYTTLYSQNHIKPYELNDRDRLFLDKVVELDISKEEFFNRSKIWIARAFKDGKEVTMHDDLASGTIIGKGSAVMKADGLAQLSGRKQYLHCTINVICKDKKARIVIDEILYEVDSKEAYNDTTSPIEFYYWKKGDPSNKVKTGLTTLKNNILTSAERFITSYEEEVSKKAAGYSDF